MVLVLVFWRAMVTFWVAMLLFLEVTLTCVCVVQKTCSAPSRTYTASGSRTAISRYATWIITPGGHNRDTNIDIDTGRGTRRDKDIVTERQRDRETERGRETE
eukprot:2583641-Rhodomonas_salina.1